MDIMNYSKIIIEKSTGYTEHIRVEYPKQEGLKWQSDYVTFWVEYNPETKETAYRKSTVSNNALEKQYEESFDELCSKVFNEKVDRFSIIHHFYDRVHLFLQERTLELIATKVSDVNGDKVRFAIDTYCKKYDFNVVLLLKDGENFSHVNVSTQENECFIGINNPNNYVNLVAAKKKIVEESEFRLQLLYTDR